MTLEKPWCGWKLKTDSWKKRFLLEIMNRDVQDPSMFNLGSVKGLSECAHGPLKKDIHHLG